MSALNGVAGSMSYNSVVGNWGEITLRKKACVWQVSQGISIYGVMNCELDVDACTQQAGGSNLILSPAKMNYI